MRVQIVHSNAGSEKRLKKVKRETIFMPWMEQCICSLFSTKWKKVVRDLSKLYWPEVKGLDERLHWKNRKTQFSVNFPFLYKLRHNETEITNSSNQGAITGSLLWWCLFFPVLKRYRTVTAGAQVLWNNLPLQYEPLLYLTTRQQSSNCFTWTKTTVTVNAESAFFGGILNTKVKKACFSQGKEQKVKI